MSFLSKVIPKTGIKVAFIDNDGKKVSGITVDQANEISKLNQDKKFYFQNGDGLEEELSIDEVNELLPTNLLPTAPACPTGPQVCGPPLVRFFGGGGTGVNANAIISPISTSIIGFDIVDSGFGFLGSPSAELIDPCGKGSGSKLQVNLEDDDEDTSNIDSQTLQGEDITAGGTPITAGGTPITAGGTGGIPITAGGIPITAGGTPITAGGTGGTPVTVGGTGGTPITAGGTPVTVGGTGGTPVTVGGTPVTVGGTPVTAGGTGGTPVTAGGTGGTPVTVGGTGGTPVTVGGVDTETNLRVECEIPRERFEKSMLRRIKRSKKIKNITILAPGDGYLSAPDGSLGGNERVWKEPDEGYVQTKCGGNYVVQPYRPIKVNKGDTYYPPDGPPRVLEENEIITLPLVPVTPPRPEGIGLTYPVLLFIEEIKVIDPGFGYRPGDKLIITPNNGATAELIINDDGSIGRVEVTSPGIGFLDLPSLRTNSPTGFNATFSTILKPIRIDITKPIEEQLKNIEPFDQLNSLGKLLPLIPDQIELISVIDCVGKV